MRTPLCDVFGIEYPIFAFTHCRDVVAAVSKAGGLGVLGAVGFSPEQLEIELDWIDEHVDGKPYGVDTVMPQKAVDVHGAERRRDAGADPLDDRREPLALRRRAHGALRPAAAARGRAAGTACSAGPTTSRTGTSRSRSRTRSS